MTLIIVISLVFVVCTLGLFQELLKYYYYRKIYRKIIKCKQSCTKIIYVLEADKTTKRSMIKNIRKFIIYLTKIILDLYDSFCKNTNNIETMFFDIDDSENIIDIIRSSYGKNQNLWIYIDVANGGNLESSDSICSAIKTFQQSPDIKKSDIGSSVSAFDSRTKHDFVESPAFKPKITCIVDKSAKSAASMLALSADILRMSSFAVLGPTDTQTNISYDNYDYPISQQLYVNIEQYASEHKISLKELSLNDVLILRDRLNTHNNDIRTFKNLKQYLNVPKRQKKMLLNIFCNNVYPHHYDFTVDYLRENGLIVKDITNKQKIILKLFNKLKKYKECCFN